MSQKSKNVTEKINEIVQAKGIKDKISEVIIKDAEGEGFASMQQLVTVKFEDPEKKPLNFFVKVTTDNPSHKQWTDELKAFEKESIFLVDYMAAVEAMCKAKGKEGFADFYPKCYYGDENMIILENLVLDKGYTTLSERHDLETARFAIRTIAKHHALGYAMIQEFGGPEKFFKKFTNFDYEGFNSPQLKEIMKPMFLSALKTNIKILEKQDVKGAKEAIAILEGFLEDPISIVLESLNQKDCFRVIGHADYHSKNMMFLIDRETNKIIHHVAIDFQGLRYNSPGLDISYYTFLGVDHEVRDKHLKELLELYRETFNGVADDFGHPSNLSYENILKEYRTTIKYGFLMGLIVAVGPGINVFNDEKVAEDTDVSKMEMTELGVIMDRQLNKWLEENPEKGIECAEILVKLVDEYNRLVLD